MPRGPLVTERVETLIALLYQEHPKWKAPMLRREVSHLLRKEDPKLPSTWPSLSSVQKVLARIREPRPRPQEKPWSLATLDSYPIPPETLPTVLKEYRRHVEEGTEFTIRQAKWVSRLSAAGVHEADLIARTEQLYELIGRPFDFRVFDRLLAGLKGEMEDLMPVFALASLAGILKDDPTKREVQNER